MAPDPALEGLASDLQFDTGQWIDAVGLGWSEYLRGQGPRASGAIALIFETLATSPDDIVRERCVQLLVSLKLPDADEALADAVGLPLSDEVRDCLLIEADNSVRLRRHTRFVVGARDLARHWSSPELDRFLSHAGPIADA